MKRCGLIVMLLFLALVVAGCDDAYLFSVTSAQPGDTYYTIQNGTEVPCDGSPGGPGCTLPFYYVERGVTYYCPGDANTPSSATIQCVQATPSAQCTPNYIYDNLIDKGQSWVVVSPQEDTNNTSSPLSVTFTATTSKSVTVTDANNVIISLGASASVPLIATITASVRNQINHSVSQSVTVAIGNSPILAIPPGKTGYANYGVRVQITSGHLYDKARCEGSKSDSGMDTTYVPIAAGWCLWIDDEQPCHSIE